MGTGQAYTSIEAAIDAAEPGDTIDISPGIYEEDALIIDGLDGLSLQGAGSDTVIIKRNSGNRGLTVTDADGVTLQGFTLRDTPEGSFGFKLQYATDLSLRDIRAVDNGRNGIDLNTTNDVTMRDVESHKNAGVGIGIRNADGVRIHGARTSGNDWGGIALWAKGNETLTDLTVRNSTFTNQTVGIYTEHDGVFRDILLHNNTFIDNTVGVLNDGAEVDVRNSVFELGGTRVDASNHYVVFTNGATGSIRSNTGEGAHRIGIFVHGEDTDAFVHGNEIIGLGKAAVGSTQNGIQIGEGSTAEVRNNRISSHWFAPRPAATGILINDSDGVTVSRNQINDCQVGIAIAAFWDSHATGNTIHGNVVHDAVLGISMQAVTDREVDDAVITDNVVTDNVLNSHNGGWVGISKISADDQMHYFDDNRYVRNKIHGFDTSIGKILYFQGTIGDFDVDALERNVVTPANT